MIYAISAVGSEFIKFGRANSVGRRLKELETACPYDLQILAVADWPDGQESAIHAYLDASYQKLEWFRDGELTRKVIAWLLDAENGLNDFQREFVLSRKFAGPVTKKAQGRRAQREQWWKANGKSIQQTRP